MQRNRTALILTLCVIPAVAIAQRGGGGGGGSRRPPTSGATTARLRFATRADFEDMSPASFLRDKRKKLQLTDVEANALKDAEAAAKKRNEVVLATYDSVRREMQKLADAPEIGSNANDAVLRRMAFSNLIGRIREQRVVDRAEALVLIPQDKKEQADALLKDQDEEFDRKAGSGRGGRGGLGTLSGLSGLRGVGAA